MTMTKRRRRKEKEKKKGRRFFFLSSTLLSLFFVDVSAAKVLQLLLAFFSSSCRPGPSTLTVDFSLAAMTDGIYPISSLRCRGRIGVYGVVLGRRARVFWIDHRRRRERKEKKTATSFGVLPIGEDSVALDLPFRAFSFFNLHFFFFCFVSAFHLLTSSPSLYHQHHHPSTTLYPTTGAIQTQIRKKKSTTLPSGTHHKPSTLKTIKIDLIF